MMTIGEGVDLTGQWIGDTEIVEGITSLVKGKGMRGDHLLHLHLPFPLLHSFLPEADGQVI